MAAQAATWSEYAMWLGLSISRLSVAFLLLPLFNSELIPAMVRNSIFVALAILVLALQPALPAVGLFDTMAWMRLFGKEVFIGTTIGFLFGSVLWAINITGQLIDTKAGTTMGQVIDPFSGAPTTHFGEFLGKLACLVFLHAGGLMLMTGAILESFAIWPVAKPLPDLVIPSVATFEKQFSHLMWIGFSFAMPAIVALSMLDLALGLINRYAQQLNVFSLSPPLKSLLATFIVYLMISAFVTLVVDDVTTQTEKALNFLRNILPLG